jgi:hypothetical protein
MKFLLTLLGIYLGTYAVAFIFTLLRHFGELAPYIY